MTKAFENLLRESTLSLLPIAKTFFILGSLDNSKILFYTFFKTAFTTSCLYGIGKGTILKKFKEKVTLQQAAIMFDNPHSTPAQIDQVGNRPWSSFAMERMVTL